MFCCIGKKKDNYSCWTTLMLQGNFFLMIEFIHLADCGWPICFPASGISCTAICVNQAASSVHPFTSKAVLTVGRGGCLPPTVVFRNFGFFSSPHQKAIAHLTAYGKVSRL